MSQNWTFQQVLSEGTDVNERHASLVQLKALSQKTDSKLFKEQIGGRQAAQEAKERLTKDFSPVHSLHLKWTAILKVQEVINLLDDLPNFREATLTHIGNRTG